MKAWGQFLALLAKWADIWLRGREAHERQERDEKVRDKPGSAMDAHFGGVQPPPMPGHADKANKASHPSDV